MTNDGKKVYKINVEGQNVFVTMDSEKHRHGFTVNMLYPYSEVLWYFEANKKLSEEEQLHWLPEIATACKNLYFLTEINHRGWIEGFRKFSDKYSNLSGNLSLDWYVENHFANMEGNHSFFPDNVSTVRAKTFFKTIMREILIVGEFAHLPEQKDEVDFQMYLWRNHYSIINLNAK